MSEVSNRSEKSIQELALTLEQASAGTQEQNEEAFQAIFKASDEQASSAVNKVSQDGVDMVQNVVDRLVLVKDSTKFLNDVIEKLDESSNQISEMVQTITHIADQINLLARNAAMILFDINNLLQDITSIDELKK
ncbi:hypothetical protein [Collibacillus ludicampi]|uniref:hypothetical protein n=1 Tax=Collibacillus ludicampi TaxID=2771369 RepID=UPI0024951ED9|nr:hypothetical protein [Collibacillus ludicampi]